MSVLDFLDPGQTVEDHVDGIKMYSLLCLLAAIFGVLPTGLFLAFTSSSEQYWIVEAIFSICLLTSLSLPCLFTVFVFHVIGAIELKVGQVSRIIFQIISPIILPALLTVFLSYWSARFSLVGALQEMDIHYWCLAPLAATTILGVIMSVRSGSNIAKRLAVIFFVLGITSGVVLFMADTIHEMILYFYHRKEWDSSNDLQKYELTSTLLKYTLIAYGGYILAAVSSFVAYLLRPPDKLNGKVNVADRKNYGALPSPPSAPPNTRQEQPPMEGPRVGLSFMDYPSRKKSEQTGGR